MNALQKTSAATDKIAAPASASLPSPAAEKTIRFAVRADGIGVLTFDRPGSSANIFDLRTLEELAQELEFIERQETHAAASEQFSQADALAHGVPP